MDTLLVLPKEPFLCAFLLGPVYFCTKFIITPYQFRISPFIFILIIFTVIRVATGANLVKKDLMLQLQVLRTAQLVDQVCYSVQGVTIPLPALPQPNLKVAQYNKTYCRKVKSFSAMDFQCLYFVSNYLCVL